MGGRITTAFDRRSAAVLALLAAGGMFGGQALAQQGRAPVELSSATLDPSDWTVRLEVAPSLETGGTHYLIEGQIETLGSITERTIVGTWIQGEHRGDFRIVMH